MSDLITQGPDICGDVFSFSLDDKMATWGTYHLGVFMTHRDTPDRLRKRIDLHAPELTSRFDRERAQCALGRVGK